MIQRPGRTTTLVVSEHELDGNVLLVELDGELDLATADQLRQVFADAEKAGYELVVVVGSEAIASTIRISGLHRLFTLSTSREDALNRR